jgi:hypothetical protein
MDQKQLWQELKLLPPQARQEVMDFIAFLRRRYQPSASGAKYRKMPLADETFFGMWRNRQDMSDSCSWVRNVRKSEWKAP